MAQVAADLEAAEASRATVETQLASRQSELTDARSLLERLGEELAAAREQVATLTERLTAARAEMKRLETEAEELRSRLNRNRLELYDSHGRIEQLTASLAEGDVAITRLDDERAQLGQEINLASEGLSAARLQADELDAELAALREALTGVRDRRGQAEVERARVQTEAEHLTRDCLSELGLPIEDVVTSVELAAGQQSVEGESAVQSGSIAAESAGATEAGEEEPGPGQTGEASSVVEQPREARAGERAVVPNADEARVRLEELRTKIDDIGPVNMMALEELEESETRFVFLSGQRSDILDSVRMTEEALAEIKRRSRERFRHAFTHINENFQRMFVELFGGGRGEMILIDEDDVLESGIDLIAQPPGKRLQNVLLLSGGEKAMAAIALVLAIFQYRPSPFCILDEVDAPLDEVNVGRFSDKVIEMGQDTQFLVITHNKRTMEAARALYGVTMEEPGVSKLVSVRFE
jgi:chromosome segregation protein